MPCGVDKMTRSGLIVVDNHLPASCAAADTSSAASRSVEPAGRRVGSKAKSPWGRTTEAISSPVLWRGHRRKIVVQQIQWSKDAIAFYLGNWKSERVFCLPLITYHLSLITYHLSASLTDSQHVFLENVFFQLRLARDSIPSCTVRPFYKSVQYDSMANIPAYLWFKAMFMPSPLYRWAQVKQHIVNFSLEISPFIATIQGENYNKAASYHTEIVICKRNSEFKISMFSCLLDALHLSQFEFDR